MQTKKCDAQKPLEQKLATWILPLVQDFNRAHKAWQSSKVGLHTGFQIAHDIMFTVAWPINLIVRIARVFAQDYLHRSIRRLVSLSLPHHSRRRARSEPDWRFTGRWRRGW